MRDRRQVDGEYDRPRRQPARMPAHMPGVDDGVDGDMDAIEAADIRRAIGMSLNEAHAPPVSC